MTVITKPLSQDRKEEKPEKAVVEIDDHLMVKPCDETVSVSDDFSNVTVEISEYRQGAKRPRSNKSASRILFISKVCLLIPAICSIIMGFSVVMHGIFKVGPRRQLYKGYCRVPYPRSILLGDLITSPSYYGSAHGLDGSGPIGIRDGLEGNTIITGDFINAPTQGDKKEPEIKQIKLMMEKLVQNIVENGKDKGKPIDYPTNKHPRAPWKHPKNTGDEKEGDETGKKFELDFDIDLDTDFEELQMPELSRGKYLHDFKVNKTAIIDKVKKRCFVFNLNRNDISPPRTLYDIFNGMMKGSFNINIEEIRQDMTIVLPEVQNIGAYGPVIKHACGKMKTFRLVPTVSRIGEIAEIIKEQPSGDEDTTDNESTTTGIRRIVKPSGMRPRALPRAGLSLNEVNQHFTSTESPIWKNWVHGTSSQIYMKPIISGKTYGRNMEDWGKSVAAAPRRGKERRRRSATEGGVQEDMNYQEFAGKFIKYNIANLNDIE